MVDQERTRREPGASNTALREETVDPGTPVTAEDAETGTELDCYVDSDGVVRLNSNDATLSEENHIVISIEE